MSEAIASVLRGRLADEDLWIDVGGDSMRPTLMSPAKVRLTAATDPRPGEVWAFAAHDGSIVVHRCMRRIHDDLFVFRGDGAAQDDPRVVPQRLIGRVVEASDPRGARSVGRGVFRLAHHRLRWDAHHLRRRLRGTSGPGRHG